VRRRLASLPLRVRLVLVAVALVACGLLVAAIATRYALERFLVQRLDQQLNAAVVPLQHSLGSNNHPSGGAPLQGLLPYKSFAVVMPDDAGNEQYFVPGGGPLPDDLRQVAEHAPLGRSSAGGYRLDVLRPTPTDPDFDLSANARLVIGIPLSDVNSTLNRLAVLELLVGLAVLAAVAVLAYVLVRRELEPLRRIEDTAAAIAGGDLSRRVEEADPATEMGSLGRSLNEMLTQIEQAFDERGRSERRLRRFVADASHELRTPLTSVRGFAELFRRGASERPADLAIVMARIEAEAQRMSLLVDDLLTLAKLDQGRPLARDQVDIGALVGELVDDHRMLYPQWPIELRAEAVGEIEGDQARLQQALANLLANSRAHTPAGTAVLVSVSSVPGGVTIEVADRGPGIPPELLDQVFERFFRADPSRTRASGGSGLGLSIVASIVQAHGGRVQAANSDEGGAVFTVFLPTTPPEDSPEGSAFRETHRGLPSG
jgi:two-component system OmpR family sensor kinase